MAESDSPTETQPTTEVQPRAAILVAVDGSNVSLRALDVAADLARLDGATLHIAHVQDEQGLDEDVRAHAQVEHLAEPEATPKPSSLAGIPGWITDCMEHPTWGLEEETLTLTHSRQVLETAKARAHARGCAKTQVWARVGDPAAMLQQLSRHLASDLIVLGHRDWGPITRFFKGSVSEEVAESTHCPCLIVT